MDMLQYFCVNVDLSCEEFNRRLLQGNSGEQISGLRSSLFLEAQDRGLADAGDELVGRRKSAGKSIKDKHAEDIWELVGAINRCEVVPRVLLKNGKRTKGELLLSREKARSKGESKMAKGKGESKGCVASGPITSSGIVNSNSAEGEKDGKGVNSSVDCVNSGNEAGLKDERVECNANSTELSSDEKFFKSSVLEIINGIRSDVASVKSEVSLLKGQVQKNRSGHVTQETCVLYVRLAKGKVDVCKVGKTVLENILGCDVVQYSMVTRNAFKVKISKNDLHGALKSGRGEGCFVDLWKSSCEGLNCSPSPPAMLL